MFLDPPYAEGAQQYAAGGTGTGLSAEVRAWAIEAGKRELIEALPAGGTERSTTTRPTETASGRGGTLVAGSGPPSGPPGGAGR